MLETFFGLCVSVSRLIGNLTSTCTYCTHNKYIYSYIMTIILSFSTWICMWILYVSKIYKRDCCTMTKLIFTLSTCLIQRCFEFHCYNCTLVQTPAVVLKRNISNVYRLFFPDSLVYDPNNGPLNLSNVWSLISMTDLKRMKNSDSVTTAVLLFTVTMT